MQNREESSLTCANHTKTGKYNTVGDNGHILASNYNLMLTETIDDDHQLGFSLWSFIADR